MVIWGPVFQRSPHRRKQSPISHTYVLTGSTTIINYISKFYFVFSIVLKDMAT